MFKCEVKYAQFFNLQKFIIKFVFKKNSNCTAYPVEDQNNDYVTSIINPPVAIMMMVDRKAIIIPVIALKENNQHN